MRTKKVGFTEPSKQGKKCVHKGCFSNRRTHPSKSAYVGFEGCLRCILCVLRLPAILVNLSIYSDHSPSSCTTGCLHFSEKNYEFEAKFTQKWYTLTGFKLLSIFVSWANYRHLYSNSRARTDDWIQTWMTAVLDSSSGFILVDFWTFPQASFLEKWENFDYSLWISLRLIILIHHDHSCWQYWKEMCS